MKTMLRVWAGIALALAAGFALAGPAAAVDDPAACDRQDAGYEAPGVCQLAVEAAAVCVNDVAQLTYALTVEGSSATTATITFVNPSGSSLVYANQPLTGTVNWPGTVTDANGKGIDWPGWTKNANGAWVAGDDFSWAVPTVKVTFDVNPEATITAVYPGTATSCLPSRSDVLSAGPVSAVTPIRSEVLSATGSEVRPVLLLAGGLVTIGAGVLVTLAVLRRRSLT